MIVNLQRKIKIDTKGFLPFAEKLCSVIEETEGGEFSVAFVSDRRMRELNKFFRGKDATTDVLSFPHVPDEFEDGFYNNPDADTGGSDRTENHPVGEAPPPLLGKEGSFEDPGAAQDSGLGTQDFLGDIVISIEQAAKQADENDLTLEAEIKQLMLHGVLHLCGYDHETDDGEMNARELELRDKLGIS